MGQEIISLLGQNSDQWTLAVSLGREDSLDNVAPESIDMVIDFSSAQVFPEILNWSHNNRKPMVSGTTGLSEKDMALLAKAARDIPLLWAPNMSLGIAMVAEMMESFAKLTDFDFQVEEFHHRHKMDSPSGTALFLQEELVKAVSSEKSKKQSSPVPQPLSVRGGGIFGVHRVFAMSENEVITLEHQALGRGVFAQGALKAAEWLKDKGPGQYSMRDVLRS